MQELEIRVATLTVELSRIAEILEQLTHPETGRLSQMERHMQEIIAIKQQASGAFKMMGALAAVATAGATAWAWIVAHLNVTPRP